MSNNPDEIRANIAATRAELSRNVDALTDTVRPGSVVRRQRDKVTSAVVGAKDAVMGTAGDVQSGAVEGLQSTGEAISSTPQAARRRAQGNPLAAGLIAVGVGWLAGSVLPATRAERQAADTLKEKAAPLAQEVAHMATETAQNLQEPAKEAVAKVTSAGADAVQTVKEEGSSTASDVADTAKDGAVSMKHSSLSG